MSISQKLFALAQHALPQHPLSRLMGVITRCRCSAFKNALIRSFIKVYGVDMSQALEPKPTAYGCFNEFFTRALKPETRPIPSDPDIVVCPADGTISQIGTISKGRVIQAKGKDFSVVELFGGRAENAEPFVDGRFATIYLSPRDYHRLHMPLDGTLREMIHVPGKLFSVNGATTANVPNLFARNERVIALFDTAAGPMALVLVGAIFVASIETVWHGVVTPPTGTAVRTWHYPDNPPVLSRGQEMGRFNMGSTVIVLFGNDVVEWNESLTADTIVRMGQSLGRLVRQAELKSGQLQRRS
ncbi:archaetidylserine decarboxylase [Methylocaldum szegediense]|uniref:Phosphatidylserine decarboxylase proenzyme n=1 Tax=Methylocaldum szegediense TaxID=73780 RepID=A0ABM9I0F0_9GAMM|nr:archaetidylserine decarboxylase [Methylocaldum szegediense]CAI8806438.1 phosphatidylserine decarboxylase proenzyme [Methylocaldum szegediense]